MRRQVGPVLGNNLSNVPVQMEDLLESISLVLQVRHRYVGQSEQVVRLSWRLCLPILLDNCGDLLRRVESRHERAPLL